jgi:hypothetical protein
VIAAQLPGPQPEGSSVGFLAPMQVANDVVLPDNADDVCSLSWRELEIVAARLLGDLPAADLASTTISAFPAIVIRSDGGE